MGKMVFTVLGAVAELERSLIVERVKAGLRNARAKGKRLGRPRVIVNVSRIVLLRGQGRSWAQITAETGISKGTAQRALTGLPTNPGFALPVSA
jgi:DNA invertase Pin-like site-specific DNA recombinase